MRAWKQHYLVVTNVGLFFFRLDDFKNWKEHYTLDKFEIELYDGEL